MLQRVTQSSFVLFTKRKGLFYLILLISIGLLSYGVSLLNISQNIYSVLPEGEGFKSFNRLISNKNISNKVAFLLETESHDEEATFKLLRNASGSIDKQCASYLAPVTYLKEELGLEIYDYYYSNFPVLIDSSYYSILSEKTRTDSITKSVQTSYRNIVSPSGSFLKSYILNDPLFLTAPFFKSLEATHENSQIKVKNGVMYGKDEKSVLMYSNVTSTG